MVYFNMNAWLKTTSFIFSLQINLCFCSTKPDIKILLIINLIVIKSKTFFCQSRTSTCSFFRFLLLHVDVVHEVWQHVVNCNNHVVFSKVWCESDTIKNLLVLQTNYWFCKNCEKKFCNMYNQIRRKRDSGHNHVSRHTDHWLVCMNDSYINMSWMSRGSQITYIQ